MVSCTVFTTSATQCCCPAWITLQAFLPMDMNVCWGNCYEKADYECGSCVCGEVLSKPFSMCCEIVIWWYNKKSATCWTGWETISLEPLFVQDLCKSWCASVVSSFQTFYQTCLDTVKPWNRIPCDFIGRNKIYLCIMYKVILNNWRCRNLVHLEANLAAFGKNSSFLQIAGFTWWLASYELVYSTYSAWYYLATRTHSPTSSRQWQMCLE